MRILADEHVPPAFVSALRAEDHDIVTVADAVGSGASDRRIFEHAIESDSIVLSADADFRGASDFDVDRGPGILACDVDARPGDVATAVRRIEVLVDDIDGMVLYVPDGWV